jgi:hypothetical protein
LRVGAAGVVEKGSAFVRRTLSHGVEQLLDLLPPVWGHRALRLETG